MKIQFLILLVLCLNLTSCAFLQEEGILVINTPNSNRSNTSASANSSGEQLRTQYNRGTDLSNRNLENLGTISNTTQQKLLLRFIRERNVEGMKNAINAGANPNYGETEEEINKPFYQAVYSSCDECVNYLIPLLADIDAVGANYNESVLYHLCTQSASEGCRKCLEVWNMDVNKGHPHMLDFMISGHYARLLTNQVLYLVSKGLDMKYYDKGFNLKGARVDVIEALANTSLSNYIDSFKDSYVYGCGEKYAVRKSKAFIKAGMNPDAGCGNCLYKAINTDNYELVKFLIDSGINVNPQTTCKTGYGSSPLQKAVDDNRDIKIINLLMEKGAK